MRKAISLLLLFILAWGVVTLLDDIPFGAPKSKIGAHFLRQGRTDTGATNIVTSVVLNYRGFDTLGEVTILFVAAVGLSAVLAMRRKKEKNEIEPASLVLYTGCRFLFPLILLFGAYIFIHGHLSPGGGFQGGAVIASAFVLVYLGCRGRRISESSRQTVDSLGGLIFVIIGLVGLAVSGHYFLSNYLPKGELNSLFSAGIIPIVYIAIGFKVGAELAGVIKHLIEESE
ncbi:Na(+)/H(+) antiporter subunit B [candidate division KSB1 bacterium]|nr:Na(+)/H(+) antiporter subunit B [candidate division KSB1 bacterium]